MEDSFSILVECAMAIVPSADLGSPDDVFRWIAIFWVLEIVKTVVGVAESVGVRCADPRIVKTAREIIELTARRREEVGGVGIDSFVDEKGKKPMKDVFVSMKDSEMVDQEKDAAEATEFCRGC